MGAAGAFVAAWVVVILAGEVSMIGIGFFLGALLLLWAFPWDIFGDSAFYRRAAWWCFGLSVIFGGWLFLAGGVFAFAACEVHRRGLRVVWRVVSCRILSGGCRPPHPKHTFFFFFLFLTCPLSYVASGLSTAPGNGMSVPQ